MVIQISLLAKEEVAIHTIKIEEHIMFGLKMRNRMHQLSPSLLHFLG